MQTDKGIVLATRLVEMLRERRILLLALNAVERVCVEAITLANRRVYKQLTESLADAHRSRLEQLLVRRQDSNMTLLGWLRQSPLRPNSRHMLEHIDVACSRLAGCHRTSDSPEPAAEDRAGRRPNDLSRSNEV